MILMIFQFFDIIAWEQRDGVKVTMSIAFLVWMTILNSCMKYFDYFKYGGKVGRKNFTLHKK